MVQHIILLVTEQGFKAQSLGGIGLMEEQEQIEQYRKAGWTKVLQEYIPMANSNVVIMAKGAEE